MTAASAIEKECLLGKDSNHQNNLKMIISISGTPGSGKSTVAKKLAEKLGYPRYYMGGLRREKAKEKGLTLEEYNKLGEKDFATDREVDEFMKELGKKEDNFIIEGRTAFHFIPHSYKIFLDVDEKVGAERIFSHLQTDKSRNEGEGLNSIEDVLRANRERMKSDKKRYKKYYNLDVFDKNHYDLYLDTTEMSEEEEFKQVWLAIKKKMA